MSAEVAVKDLVFDPRLQCREAMCEETIARYAEAMKDGAEFPAIVVVIVDGRALVADGWHRAKAAALAGLRSLRADVESGTFLDAVKVAAGANENHGLQRSHAAKRRSTLLVLQQEEFCKLNSRGVAEIARVSHTYVNRIRREFGVKRGQVLTSQRRAEVEGVPPAEWQAVITSEWRRDQVLKLRFQDLRKLARTQEVGLRPAVELRLSELGTEPWAWPEDDTEGSRRERAETVDTVEDLEKVLRAKACPLPRFDVFEVFQVAFKPEKVRSYELAAWVERCDKRPALRAALLPVMEEKQQAEERTPWRLAQRWYEGEDLDLRPSNPDFNVADVLRYIRQGLHRYPDQLPRARALYTDIEDCLIPGCDGWLRPKATREEGGTRWAACCKCDRTKEFAQKQLRQAVRWTAQALQDQRHGDQVAQALSPQPEQHSAAQDATDNGEQLPEDITGETPPEAAAPSADSALVSGDAEALKTSMRRGLVLQALLDAATWPDEFWTWIDQGPPIVGIAMEGWIGRPSAAEEPMPEEPVPDLPEEVAAK